MRPRVISPTKRLITLAAILLSCGDMPGEQLSFLKGVTVSCQTWGIEWQTPELAKNHCQRPKRLSRKTDLRRQLGQFSGGDLLGRTRLHRRARLFPAYQNAESISGRNRRSVG